MARRRRSDDAADDTMSDGEYRSSSVTGRVLISGPSIGTRSVAYSEVEGLALAEGDMILGDAEVLRDAANNAAAGVAIVGVGVRWPNAIIPYEVDPNLTDQARVTDAIAHWEANTPIRFVRRTAANAAQHASFVRFRPGGGCSSNVGRVGGRQGDGPIRSRRLRPVPVSRLTGDDSRRMQ